MRSELDLTIGNQTPFDETFSVEWNGKIKIERKGNHTFETISDDGSLLYIDDQLVVDNGRGGAARSKTGSIHLEAGYHSIKIKYFQNRGVKEHKVNWKPPGKSKQPITVQKAFNSLSHTR